MRCLIDERLPWFGMTAVVEPLCSRNNMDVTHPGSKPLTEDQTALLRTFRRKVESRISSHGMTAADVQTFVDEIKRHPDVSTALLQELRSEVNRLMQGQRFSFDFD